MSAEAAARQLLQARSTGQKLLCLPPDLRPASVDEAYAIHEELLRHLSPVAGWKVGKAPCADGLACAPIFGGQLHRSPASLPASSLPGRLVEVEVGFECVAAPGADFDPGRMEEWLRPALALELISGRFQDVTQVTSLELLADSNCCGAVVIGDWLAPAGAPAPATIAAEARYDGFCPLAFQLDVAGSAARAAWAVAALRRRSLDLEVGQVIITGTQVSPALIFASACATTGSEASVSLSLDQESGS